MDLRRIADPGTLEFARQLIKAEQLRRDMLDEHFSAAEWQILLELFVATEEGRPTAVTDMGLVEGIARSTALGLVADMTRRGILIRDPDPSDGRRSFLSLDEDIHRRINGLLLSLRLYLRAKDLPGQSDDPV